MYIRIQFKIGKYFFMLGNDFKPSQRIVNTMSTCEVLSMKFMEVQWLTRTKEQESEYKKFLKSLEEDFN